MTQTSRPVATTVPDTEAPAVHPPPRRRRDRLAATVGLALVLACLVWFIAAGPSFYLYILNSVLLAVIGASALNLLQGTVGQVSIGNAAFLVVGAYGCVMALREGIGYPWDLVLGMAAGAVVGAIVGLPAIRIRGFYLAFATLAAHFILVQLAQSYQTHAVGSAGFEVPMQFTGESLSQQQRDWAILLAIVATVVLILVRLLTSARLGRTWRVIRDHEIIASSLGIRVPLYKLAAFMISSALIALQGGLAAHLAGSVNIDTFTLSLAVSYVAMVLIGGLDSLLGSVLGAVIVTALPYITSNVMGSLNVSTQYSAQIAEAIYGVLVVVFVVFSSAGVAGWLRSAYRFASSRVPARRVPAVSDGRSDHADNSEA